MCDHGRYNLGDKDGHSDASDAICASRSFKQKWDEDYDFSHGPDLWEMIQECEDIVSLPLYLFDHSGLALSTKRFSCPWDSGQVGFTFMTRATILKETGSKRLTKKAREWALSYLEAEADVYDKFLSGETYGFVVEDSEGDELEACYGFYGTDDVESQGVEAFEQAVQEASEAS